MTSRTSLGFAYGTHEVRVVFADGGLATLPAELERAHMRDIVLLTTPSRPADRSAMVDLLGSRLAGQFAGARLHVPVEVVNDAMAVVDQARPDGLLAFGGGSAIGLGKALAHETGLPLAAIPTTYSGSEMTAIWGTTDGKAKRTVRDPRVAPRLVLYDPVLTHGLTPQVSAVSGMNAIAHCVEAEYAPEGGPVTSWFASEGIRHLARTLPVIMRAPHDAGARSEALFGAHLAGRALDMSAMGLHHKLAHVLGGSFGMPHAETHAALLPWVAAWNAPAADAAMRRVAAALGVDDAADGLASLARTLGTPTLADLGFSQEQIPRAAELVIANTYPNPRAVDAAGVRWILERALRGAEA